jgi:hypothetical protein
MYNVSSPHQKRIWETILHHTSGIVLRAYISPVFKRYGKITGKAMPMYRVGIKPSKTGLGWLRIDAGAIASYHGI